MLYKIAQENLYKEAGLFQAFKSGVGKLKDKGVKILGGVTKKDATKQKFDLQGKINQKEMRNNALKSDLNDANLQVDTLSKRLNNATQEINKHKEQVKTVAGLGALGTAGGIAGTYALTRSNRNQNNV